MEFFVQLIITGTVIGSIYALLALGFTLIYKATDVVNFAQGELLMVGAYICLHLTVSYSVPFWASFLITLVFSFTMGFFIEKVFLRR